VFLGTKAELAPTLSAIFSDPIKTGAGESGYYFP